MLYALINPTAIYIIQNLLAVKQFLQIDFSTNAKVILPLLLTSSIRN